MEKGMKYISKLVVTEDKTAAALGSGDLPVLATPIMVALMENAAMMAVADALPEGSTTVGGKIDVSHLAPTPVGAEVTATAVLESVEGRKLVFHVEAHQGELLLGEGSHLRFVVDRDKFMAKLGK